MKDTNVVEMKIKDPLLWFWSAPLWLFVVPSLLEIVLGILHPLRRLSEQILNFPLLRLSSTCAEYLPWCADDLPCVQNSSLYVCKNLPYVCKNLPSVCRYLPSMYKISSQYSMFGSLVTIGAMLGAITSGRIADFMGRKGAMRMSSGFCITGWLAIFFSKGSFSLDLGRFFTGYGIGIISYVVPVYIAEIAPKNLRGGLATAIQLMIATGSSVSFLIGSIVTWRTLALSGLMPLISLLIGLCFIPESPRWLAKVGREKDFQAALGRLRGKDTDISEEAAEILDYIASLGSLPQAKFLDLFQSQHVRSVVIGVGIMVCQQFVGINGIGFYAAETFVAAGLSSSNIGTIGYACIQIPITLLGAILMDKSGRKPLVMVSASGTFIGCFITGIAFLLKGQNLLLDWVPKLAVAGVLIYIAAYSIGMGPVPWVIMSEIFPINVKGMAGSLVVLVTWFGAWIVSYTYNFLMSWNAPGTLFLYGGCSLVTIVFVAKFVPETKGKTLEEIQASINS